MQQIKFEDPTLFRYLFSAISRFVDDIIIEVSPESFKITSIDPHDFCFLNINMLPDFFKEYEISTNVIFSISVKKIGKILPKLSSAKEISLRIHEDSIEILASEKWNISFKIYYLTLDPEEFLTPNQILYDCFAKLDAKEFSAIINVVSSISNEIKFKLVNGRLEILASDIDYSLSGKYTDLIDYQCDVVGLESEVVVSYLKQLIPLINRCDLVSLNLGSEKPVKIDIIKKDKATFSFVLSHKKRSQNDSKLRINREGTSLPRLSVSKFPDFLRFISGFPQGVSSSILINAGLETKGGDYHRLGNKLNLSKKKKKKIYSTDKGIIFTTLLQSDINDAKKYLHSLVLENYKSYETMIKILKETRPGIDELYDLINAELKMKDYHKIDRQDMTTLLGIGLWCEIIDKKLA